MYIHLCLHYIYIHIIYICSFPSVCVYIKSPLFLYVMYVCIYIKNTLYVCIRVCVYIYIYIHIYIYIYIYIHTHTHTRKCIYKHTQRG